MCRGDVTCLIDFVMFSMLFAFSAKDLHSFSIFDDT